MEVADYAKSQKPILHGYRTFWEGRINEYGDLERI